MVSVAAPPSPSIAPPVEVTAPVSAPLRNVPPASATLLIVCVKPPRSSVPAALIVVALAAENRFAAPPANVPASIAVAPVYVFAPAKVSVPDLSFVKVPPADVRPVAKVTACPLVSTLSSCPAALEKRPE